MKNNNEEKYKEKIVYSMMVIICIVVYGCFPGPLTSFVNDMSANRKLWGGYRLNGIYRLNVDMFLMDNSNYPTPNKFMLVAPRNSTRGIYNLFFSPPSSIEEYLKNKSEWKEVVSILKKGSRIKCTRLLKYTAIGSGSSLYIKARIMNGPLAGREVEVGDLSHKKFNKELDLFLLSPNPKLLSFEGVSS